MIINQEKIIDMMSSLNLASIKEFGKLLTVNTIVQFKNFWEYLKVIISYYPSWRFFKADAVLLLTYLFDNPFSISKRFLANRGEENVYAYGETPLTTLNAIVKECRLKPQQTVYELGCGRGRACLWLNCFYNCKVVGIDHVPEFTLRAERIVQKLQLSNISFINEDMLRVDFKDADVVYLYGTCLDDTFIEKLVEKFAKLPSGTKIITVSYPLTDYDYKDRFEVMKRFPAKFTWGTADIYLQIVK
ncbi:hypothetical protein PHSC3_000276 [Chlamydiales bacterium STE3]|nr:hypothetical protein PHSC3_000276 [Chlamydiales bacterium STE3]